MCVTHGMPCVNMHGTFESYNYGSSNSVRGEQKEEGGGKERRNGGKEKKRKEEKEKKKKGGIEEKERGKEGVSHSEQTQTAKNSELCNKR